MTAEEKEWAQRLLATGYEWPKDAASVRVSWASWDTGVEVTKEQFDALARMEATHE